MSTKTLYQSIYETLKNEIQRGVLKEGDMLPSEQELANRFFSSRITVRRAMKMLVDDDCINRIPGCGTFVKRPGDITEQRNGTLGVVLSNISSNFGAEFLVAIERFASTNKYNIIFRNSGDSQECETRSIKELIESNINGLIIQPIHCQNHNEEILKLSLTKFPVVFIDRHLDGVPYSSVSTDNVLAAKTATEYLMKKGHDHIAFISFLPNFTSSLEDRYNGWKQAFFDNHKVASPESVCFLNHHYPSLNDEENKKMHMQEIQKFLTANPHITAILSCELSVCRPLFPVLAKMGKSVPNDISIVSFDKSEDSFGNEITYIQQDQLSIGETAAKLLVDCITKKTSTKRIKVPFNLIENGSVKKL